LLAERDLHVGLQLFALLHPLTAKFEAGPALVFFFRTRNQVGLAGDLGVVVNADRRAMSE
jgi:hypothetical protein